MPPLPSHPCRRLLGSPDCELLFNAYQLCHCGSGAGALALGTSRCQLKRGRKKGRPPAWRTRSWCRTPATAALLSPHPTLAPSSCTHASLEPLQKRPSGSAASGRWRRTRAACCGRCTICASECRCRAGRHSAACLAAAPGRRRGPKVASRLAAGPRTRDACSSSCPPNLCALLLGAPCPPGATTSTTPTATRAAASRTSRRAAGARRSAATCACAPGASSCPSAPSCVRSGVWVA